MKKIVLFFSAIMMMCTCVFAQKRIAVVEPKVQGLEDDAWIAYFLQGQITSNLKKYSKMEVIDRQAIDKAIKEKKVGTSEGDDLRLGELLTANYIVIVSILKKGASYAITANVTDAEKGTAVGKSYSNLNCTMAELESGSEINNISYELLLGLGASASDIEVLKNKNTLLAQKAELSANANIAKGIAIEKSGGSIVEAMAYYQKASDEDSLIDESTQRINNLTTNLSGGEIYDEVLAQIEMRDQWKKIWADYIVFANENVPYVIFSRDIEQGKVNYENKTVELKLYVATSVNPVVQNLYMTLYSKYNSLKDAGYEIDRWGIKTTPNDYNDYYYYKYTVTVKGVGGEVLHSSTLEAKVDMKKEFGFSTKIITFTADAMKAADFEISVVPQTKGGIIYASSK